MAEREMARTYSLGRIQASIMRHTTENGGSWYAVRIFRKYWDGHEEKEKESTSFFAEDLSVVIQAAGMADAWIMEQKGLTPPAQDAVA